MTEKEKQKKIQSLVQDLFSTKKEIVQAALKKIPEEGNASLIIPLLRTYKAWERDVGIQEEIAKILGELKTESAVPELITALEDDEFENMRALILWAFWNSGLYPVEDLDVIVKHAIRGDFYVTLEAITVIENMEAPSNIEIIQDAIFDIDDFLDEHPEEPHSPLLTELKEILNTLYNQ